jgi:Ca2+:H+ antiporter
VVLTLSVIVIELSLIGRTMLTGDKNPTLARDSMFSVLMIALTGITGCA